MSGILNELVGIKSASTSNPNIGRQVVLRLTGDGTNGAQNNTFIDGSTNAFTITRTGNPTQGTFTPFSCPSGYWSNYFNGSNAYHTIATDAAFTYGTGDFTMECFFYLEKTGAAQYLIDQRNSGTATAIIPTIYISASNVLNYYVNGANVITGATALVAGNWYHVAVARSGTSTKLFLNGTQEGSTYSDSNNYASSRVVIGSAANTVGSYFQGYISNVRLVKGTAVYTSAFTVPTSPLTAITNTSLLTCRSNIFNDISSNNFTITPSGTLRVSNFGFFSQTAAYSSSVNGGSGFFDGSGDYLRFTGTNTAFEFGTGDWTVECWVYITTTATSYVWDFRPTSTGGAYPALSVSSTSFSYVANSTTAITGTTAPKANVWYHVVVARSGTSTKMFINGVQEGSTYTDSTNYTVASDRPYIGSDSYGSTNPFFGFISDFRIVKGTAVYTSNFTPPTAPLTAISGTSALLNFINAGIIDNSETYDLETVGNVQINTSVKKYGTGSISFDGSGDYLLLRGNLDTLTFGSGNFTIEFWIYLNSTQTSIFVDGRSNANQNGAVPTIYVSSNVLLYFTNNANRITGTTLSNTTWQHIAVARSGTSTKMFVDGVQVGSTYTDTVVYTNEASRPVIGINGIDLSTFSINGYVDDLRIVKGIAVYTANFTPPTAALPLY